LAKNKSALLQIFVVLFTFYSQYASTATGHVLFTVVLQYLPGQQSGKAVTIQVNTGIHEYGRKRGYSNASRLRVTL